MAKRFGRNQKRRMREEIAKLSERAISAERRSFSLQAQLSNAEGRAFERFMADAKRYEHICARMADEVGRLAGEKLKPYAEQLMREANKQRPMARFDASFDMNQRATIVTVEWPAVRYNYAVMP